jgi:formamidopyrimidine-DNA glycosylase
MQRRRADYRAVGRRVGAVETPEPGLLDDGLTPDTLAHRLQDRRLATSRRHGKYLFLAIDADDWLLLHFGMTGHLVATGEGGARPKHSALVLTLDDGTCLSYVAPRKLGRIALIEDPDAFAADTGLGPDALALDRATFVQRIAGSRAGIKCRLMDQGVLAGLGNVYSDEILFQARLHPKTPVAALDEGTLARLHDRLRRVLTAAIEAEADPAQLPDDYLLPHRAPNAVCPRCGGELVRIKACGRTAYICPACQSSPASS